MLHTIQFRGRTLNFNIEKGVNTNFISEITGAQTKKFCSIGHETNNNAEVLNVKYLQLIEVEGDVVENSTVMKPTISKSGSYDRFYSMYGEFGELVNAELNFISEKEIDSQCIAFNPLKSFDPIQPITCDFTTTESGVSVSVIDEPIDSVSRHCWGFGGNTSEL